MIELKLREMRIFYAFLIIIVSAMLFMLPVDEAIYNFRTAVREDDLSLETGVAETTGNVTLVKALYDDDTGTVSIFSDLYTDAPLLTSYNTTTRMVFLSGLTASSNRTLTVTYDIDALNPSGAIDTLMDRVPFIWMLVVIAFPAAGLFAIFTGRV